MKFKNVLAGLLATTMVLTAVGCGSTGDANGNASLTETVK